MNFGTINGFHIYAIFGVATCSIFLMLLLREPKTPKWLDASVAITLLLLAALFLGMIQAIFNKLPSTAFEQRDLKSEYQVALYIIPFFTAGIESPLVP